MRYPLLRACQRRLTLRNVIFALIFLVIFYKLLFYIHTETYVWQTTTLAGIMRPTHRDECPLKSNDVLGEPLLRTTWTSDATIPNVSTGILKIGIVMLFSISADGKGDWPQELMTRVILNRVHYCEKHGYTPIVVSKTDNVNVNVDGNETDEEDIVDSTRPIAWSKFLAIQTYLPDYDYLTYIDMDAVIMNFNTPIESFIEATGPCSDIILTEDWNGPNTGMFIIKNSQWSRWFISHAYEVGLPLVEKKSALSNKAHPFEYEQRVVHYLLESNIWIKRKLSKYHMKNASNYIRSHVSILPQCAFNSYSLHPFDSRGLPDDISRYNENENDKISDFLVHFAGKKGQIKINLIDHYLSQIENKLKTT